MNTLYIVLALFLGLLLCAALYGICALLEKYLPKRWTEKTGAFLLPLVSILPTVAVLCFSGKSYLNLSGFQDSFSWVLSCVTVGIVVLSVSGREHLESVPRGKMLLSGAAGAAMEIPQRLLMQTFLLLLLSRWNVPSASALSCFLNGLIWCSGIAAQTAIARKKPKSLSFDLVASFLFSIGIGMVFLRSELILLPMIAHFAERVFSQLIENRRAKRV